MRGDGVNCGGRGRDAWAARLESREPACDAPPDSGDGVKGLPLVVDEVRLRSLVPRAGAGCVEEGEARLAANAFSKKKRKKTIHKRKCNGGGGKQVVDHVGVSAVQVCFRVTQWQEQKNTRTKGKKEKKEKRKKKERKKAELASGFTANSRVRQIGTSGRTFGRGDDLRRLSNDARAERRSSASPPERRACGRTTRGAVVCTGDRTCPGPAAVGRDSLRCCEVGW